MSNLLDAIMGVSESDVPPVLAARPKPVNPQRREPPRDEEEAELKKKAAKARTSAVLQGILGESDKEGIIPNDAKAFDSFSVSQMPGIEAAPDLDTKGPSEPAAISGKEELIQPTAALVAPDITPNVLQLIDPSQVPAPPRAAAPPVPPMEPAAPMRPQHALDTLMGRQNTEPQPEDAADATAMAEALVRSMHPAEVKVKVAEALIPGQEGGTMPDHKASDGKRIYEAFRRFNR